MSSYHLYFLTTSLYGGRELEIIPSLRASIEGESSEFFQVLNIILEGGDLGISVSPKASIEGAKSRAYIRGGSKVSLEGKARNYAKSRSLL